MKSQSIPRSYGNIVGNVEAIRVSRFNVTADTYVGSSVVVGYEDPVGLKWIKEDQIIQVIDEATGVALVKDTDFYFDPVALPDPDHGTFKSMGVGYVDVPVTVIYK